MIKKYQIFVMLSAAGLLLSACGGKKQRQDIIAPRVEKAVPREPIRMQEYNDERQVDWQGRRYTVAIHREPCDSVAMVKDETGQQFVDNIFSLRVVRSDGTVFCQRTFSKQSVAMYLDDVFRRQGVFEGLVFDRVDGGCLVLAASVGLPQTDEYIPLVLRLSADGSWRITRDSQMDTTGDTPLQEPSSEEI